MLSLPWLSLAGLLLAVGINNGELAVTGTEGADVILVSQVGNNIVVDVNGVQTPFDAAGVRSIRIEALGGDDTVVVDVDRPTTILGGAGNDFIVGSDGGADEVIGGTGFDTFFGRGGDDVFVWNPGDGSDFVEGGDGFDTMLFVGAGANETFDVSAAGDRVRFFRNPGNIVMDCGTTEKLDVRALGGDDATTIHDLSGTGVTQVFVDGGAGNDTFVGSDSVGEVFLGGDGDDTATLGDGGVFDGGAGFDTLLVHGTDSRDEIHFDAQFRQSHEEAFLFGTVGKQRTVFDNGEAVTIFTDAGDDRVSVHRKAAALWDVHVVQ